MKLSTITSLEVKGVEFPEFTSVPPFADNTFASRVFGAFCKINPELDCMQDKVFLKNVNTVLKNAGYKGDFLPIETNTEIKKWRDWYAEEKERKAAFRKENAETLKTKREALKSEYGYAIVDGSKEPLGSWVVEPEGFFFGRGDSPIKGMWKQATLPEEVVINTNSKNLPKMIKGDSVIGYNFQTEWNPEGHYPIKYIVKIGIPNSEGKVLNPKATTYKHVQFGSVSSIKKEGQSKKYEASENLLELKSKLDSKIEDSFKNNKNIEEAIAVFIMMNKGIRVGKSTETRNGTKGLLTLDWGKDVKRVNDSLKFSFVGKDSVKDNSVLELPVDKLNIIESVWKIQGRLKTTSKEITEYVKEIDETITFSPKLLRTMVAAATMTNALNEVTLKYKLTVNSSEALKKLAFDEANFEVAKKLNHQKGTSKAAEARKVIKFKESQEKLKEKETKAKELETKRKEKIKELTAKGKTEEVKKLKELIAKSKEKIATNKKRNSFKENSSGFATGTSKTAYIDPKIVSEWCSKVGLDISKIYTKTQLEQFSERI